MPVATLTLGSVTLAQSCAAGESPVKFSSATGLTPGVRVFADAELMAITSQGLTDTTGTWFEVRRGVDGTSSSAHSGSITCRYGSADSFYANDPVGAPGPSVPVLPYINVLTGWYWQAMGDDQEGGRRWWARQLNEHSAGPLGINAETAVTSEFTDQ